MSIRHNIVFMVIFAVMISASVVFAEESITLTTLMPSAWAASSETGHEYDISYITGNVGIGSTEPIRTLDINKSQNAVTGIQISNATDTSGAISQIVFNQGTSPEHTFILGAYNSSHAWIPFRLRGAITTDTDSDGITIAARKSTGTIDFYTGESAPATTRMRISSNGNVGIGITAPGYKLTVSGTTWCSSGAWAGSDLRWKKNIEILSNPLDKLSRLRGVTYDWKREEFKGNNFPEGKQIGIVAQEMEREYPELVTTNNDGYKAIAYDRFTAVLLESVKNLELQTDALKAKNSELESRIKQLELKKGTK